MLEFLERTEPIWLFVILLIEMIAGIYTAYMVKREYEYDEAKDLAKKQRRTKTTKKTVTQPGGASTTEESVEVTEPVGEQK